MGELDREILKAILGEGLRARIKGKEPLLPSDDQRELFWVLRNWEPLIEKCSYLYLKQLGAAYAFLALASEANLFRKNKNVQQHADNYLKLWEAIVYKQEKHVT